ncbi:C6 transcription factor [Xylogone sp. PMI_703]|nr:C6 transcription factor [Xylogone sp. PMI_703]
MRASKSTLELPPASRHSNLSGYVKRIPTACNRCRKRKTKCLGGIPCRTCARTGKECTYPVQEKKVLISEDYLHELEARAFAHERGREFSKDKAAQSSSQPPSLPVREPNFETENDDIDENPLIEETAHLVFSQEGEQQYLGESSSTSLGLRLRELVTSGGSGLESGIDVGLHAHKRSILSFHRGSSRLANQPETPLPPFDVAKRLYAAQYANIGTIFSFTQPDTFEKSPRALYKRAPDLTDRNVRLSYCQVLLVLAFGQMYSINQWTSNDGPPGFEYFQQALQLLPDIHEQGSVTFVEVLSLVGYFFQNMNLQDVAFLYIGLALRMAISLGLHQEVSDQNLGPRAREHRRRAWWILSVKSGNPLTIADQDVGVLPPSRLPDEPEDCPAIVLYQYTELSRILGKIMKNVYRRTRTTKYSLVASVRSILTDLSNWHTNLPQRLKIDFTKLDQGISREVISIYLHYNQCINMTARPLVFHVVRSRLQNKDGKNCKSDWKTGLSPTTITVIDTCISTARNTVAICAVAAKQNMMATYGYMDGEHLFSAAIILVMVNIAFPCNARDHTAMKSALDVMNSMAEKGNAHLKSLNQLLLNLLPQSDKNPGQVFVQDPIGPLVLHQPPYDEPPPAPVAPPISQNDLIAEGYLDLNQSVFQSVDGGSVTGRAIDVDAIIWEEGYETFDLNMDFDWTQWNNQESN